MVNIKVITGKSHHLTNNMQSYINITYTAEKPEPAFRHLIDRSYQDKSVHKDVDFDDLLPHIGNFGKYQIILFLLLAPYTVFYVFVYFTQIFITLVPSNYWCKVPELQHLELDQRLKLSVPLINGEMSKCSMYAVNYTELLFNDIKVADPLWPLQSCIFGYEFDHSEIPYTTIATELGWVCEDASLPTIAQSIFFFGAISGGLLFGWIADRFGRVPALLGTNVVGGIAGILTAFCNNFWTFALCRYFAGFAFDNCYTIMYILALEYVGAEWRTFVANMCTALYFGFGALLMPWIAFWINDWKLLTIVLSVPLLVALFTPWMVPESARWLVSQNRMDEAIEIIHKFERVNKKTIDPEVFSQFVDTCHKNNEKQMDTKYSLLDLFKTPRLRKITLLSIVIFMSVSLVYDGYIRCITSIDLNIFTAFTLASATEFPASSLLTYVLDRWGRRWLLFGTMALSSMCNLALSFTVTSNAIVSLVLMMTGRFFVNFSYNIGQQIAMEYLPTVVRGQGVAFIHNLGYVANVISPFVIYLQVINPSIPFWILAVVGLIGGLSILFLPETMGNNLPQTMEEAENFGLNDKFWDNPCISKSRTISIGDE